MDIRVGDIVKIRAEPSKKDFKPTIGYSSVFNEYVGRVGKVRGLWTNYSPNSKRRNLGGGDDPGGRIAVVVFPNEDNGRVFEFPLLDPPTPEELVIYRLGQGD